MRGARRFAALLTVLALTTAQAADVTVIDGDSLELDGHRVEIWGIIAPMRGETCSTRTGERWPCGERAREALAAAAADDSFACEEREPGFVNCRAGGLDVGLLLVREGLARARQDYADAEARAREAAVGLWE